MEFSPHLDALSLKQMLPSVKPDNSVIELCPNRSECSAHLFIRRNELFGREKSKTIQGLSRRAGQRIENGDLIDFIAEEFDPNSFFISGGGMNFHYIPANAEHASRESQIDPLE